MSPLPILAERMRQGALDSTLNFPLFDALRGGRQCGCPSELPIRSTLPSWPTLLASLASCMCLRPNPALTPLCPAAAFMGTAPMEHLVERIEEVCVRGVLIGCMTMDCDHGLHPVGLWYQQKGFSACCHPLLKCSCLNPLSPFTPFKKSRPRLARGPSRVVTQTQAAVPPMQIRAAFGPLITSWLGNFVENHDQSRFLCEKDDVRRYE